MLQTSINHKGTGLILIGVGAWMAFHAYNNLFIGGKAKILLKTLGEGKGSNYRVRKDNMINLAYFTSQVSNYTFQCSLKRYVEKMILTLTNMLQLISKRRIVLH